MAASALVNLELVNDNDFFLKQSGQKRDVCFHCEDIFEERENKIIFNNCQYHKRCFVFGSYRLLSLFMESFSCAQCLEELEVDLVFQNEKRMYCLHDYKMLFAPSCKRCNKFILEGKVIKALEHTWHADCFLCSKCKTPLAEGNTFKKFENSPFCQKCYDSVKDAYAGLYICQRCKGSIEHDGFLKFEGDFYHPYHFKCTTCHNELDKTFREKDGNYFCIRCFDRMGIPICTACKRPVEERVVYAMGKAYHVDHFVCSFCNKPFLGTKYFVHNKDVYCESHYRMVAVQMCCYCNKDAGPNSVSFLSKVYCLDHFRCFACDCLLDKNTSIFKVDRKPICKHCLTKIPAHLRRRLANLHKNET